MIEKCFSLMPQGVEHRYTSPCEFKFTKAWLTSDAVRRLKNIRVTFTSSSKIMLDSRRTENVTLGVDVWVCRRFKFYRIKFALCVTRLIGTDFRQRSFGIVLRLLKTVSKRSVVLSKTINFYSIELIDILTLVSLSISCWSFDSQKRSIEFINKSMFVRSLRNHLSQKQSIWLNLGGKS